MKNLKRVSALMLALLMALCMGISSFALATPAEVATEAKEVVTVSFAYKNIMGINGTFTYSDADLFSKIEVSPSGLNGEYNPENGMVAYYGSEPTDSVITLTLTVAEDAVPGDKCVITFEYETTEDGQLPSEPVYEYDTATITIGAPAIDYTALIAQIDRAEALTESDYTPDSWAAMIEQLAKAKALVNNAETQDEVDAMTAALKAAIDALVRVSLPPVPPTGDVLAISAMMLVVGLAAAGVVINRRKSVAK